MAREQFPVSPEQLPEEARQYMTVIQAHQEHPFVKQFFHQVTWLNWVVPNHGQISFFAVEFRDGLNSALAWQDGEGNWGAGKWVHIAHADADITCPPSPVSIQYFEGNKAWPTFHAVLEQLTATKQVGPGRQAKMMSLNDALTLAVAALQSHGHLDDEQIIRTVVEQGVDEPQAVRLVQFIPIAFCRFVFRGSGVQFAENYVVLGPDGQPRVELPLQEDPVYKAAMAHCEAAVSAGQGGPYFLPVAARSGGFQAVQELLQKGSRPEHIRTGPPVILA